MTKNWKRQLLTGGFILAALLVVYNYWSYRSGRCTVSMLMSISPVVLALIGCNLLVGAVLFFIKNAKESNQAHSVCSCGQAMTDNRWRFCPQCGRKKEQ
ncbi:MAG: hypothetical protein OQK97_03705 [Deltaproteobacteria bacterium]|jgi:hypothetical protein|nr:hypothetical protein [Deltaproteobacteria bacterium]MCW8892120.1 hypothetical protein [Deltaproteobacteria bacterium]